MSEGEELQVIEYIGLIKKLDQFRIIFCAVLDFFLFIVIYAFALAQCQKALSVIF